MYICGVENVGDNQETQHGWMLRWTISMQLRMRIAVSHGVLTVPDYRNEINAHSF